LVVLPPFGIIGEVERPEPWFETVRPGALDGTELSGRWSATARGFRWDAVDLPAHWYEQTRPASWEDLVRPLRWGQSVFVREDRAVALTLVAYGPFTENEVPEALLIRVFKPLRAGGTAPLEIFAQTPAYTATVSIEDPLAAVVSRPAEIMDPADLPIDYPDDFVGAEEGWVRIAWAPGDFDADGLYRVQVTLDNGTVVLKSTDVWTPEVNVGPASAVT
jgi:hypothetical protein